MGAPSARLVERGAQHKSGQPSHQVGVFGRGYELGRGDEATHGMFPAQQRLDALDHERGGIDLGLVDERELVIVERSAEVGHQAQPVDIVSVAIGVIDRTARARALRLIHGDVCVLQEAVRICALLRI